jgi:transcriptional regulator with XRE-family HTH domain
MIAAENLSPFNRLLQDILRRDRAEISRVARELEVSENTIYRWMNGNSVPRAVYLKKLPDVLSEHRSNLTFAINQTFGKTIEPLSPGIPEVGKGIYRHIIDLVTTVAEDGAYFWQISQAIFESAHQHLDAGHNGLAITYAFLMPPRADGIHSLRELVMSGTEPWPSSLESKIYLGSTTLAGTAVLLQRLQTWDSLDSEERFQVTVDDFECSACAYPVMRGGRLAGVLTISSALPGFFKDYTACGAVMEYAKLFSLALHERDFYPSSLLHLEPMPDLRWQRQELARSYVTRVITCAHKYALPRQEAEQRVQQEMELEFEERARALAASKPLLS